MVMMNLASLGEKKPQHSVSFQPGNNVYFEFDNTKEPSNLLSQGTAVLVPHDRPLPINDKDLENSIVNESMSQDEDLVMVKNSDAKTSSPSADSNKTTNASESAKLIRTLKFKEIP